MGTSMHCYMYVNVRCACPMMFSLIYAKTERTGDLFAMETKYLFAAFVSIDGGVVAVIFEDVRFGVSRNIQFYSSMI